MNCAKICRNCSRTTEDDWHEYTCTNRSSRYFNKIVDDFDTCNEWTGKETENEDKNLQEETKKEQI